MILLRERRGGREDAVRNELENDVNEEEDKWRRERSVCGGGGREGEGGRGGGRRGGGGGEEDGYVDEVFQKDVRCWNL